jgi:hypothetical protein
MNALHPQTGDNRGPERFNVGRFGNTRANGGAGELRTRRVGSEAEPAGAYAALEPPPRLRTQRWTSARSRSAGKGLGRMLQGVAMPSSESAAVA